MPNNNATAQSGLRGRAKYFVFTVNNYTDAEVKDIDELVERRPFVSYVCYGKEVGDQGTPHLQGYLELSERKRGTAIRKLDGLSRAHLEVRKGTQSEAITYCQKEADFYEFGTKSEVAQGQRTDLEEVKEALDTGSSIAEIAENHFSSFVRYERSFRSYQQLRTPRISREVEVYILWGKSGTGKTRIIFETFPDVFICPDPTLKWFDGYEGEDVILIDEYRGEAASSFVLRVLDRYPLRVPIKCGFREMKATKIFITSNMPPPFGHHDIQEPFNRRVKEVFKMDLNIYREGAEEEVEYIRSRII